MNASSTDAVMNTRTTPPRWWRWATEVLSNWRLIALCVAVAAGAGALIALTAPPTYEATAALVLLPPPYKTSGDEITAMMPRVLSVPDYEILLRSDGTIKSVAERVRALGNWDEDELETLADTRELRKRLLVDVEVTQKTVSGVSYSPVMVLRARADTPEHARDLAQTWAAVAETIAQELSLKGKTGVKEFIDQRFTEARDELVVVTSAIRDVEIEWNDELEEARLQNKHGRLLGYEEKMIDLSMQISATEQEVAALEADFAKEEQTLTLWKSPPATALFLQGRTQLPQETPEGTRAPGYQEDVLNESFFYLEQKLMLKRSELAGMREHRAQLQTQIDGLNKELQELRAQVAQRAFERKQLDLQQLPLQNSYNVLAEKLEQAKVAEAEQEDISDLRVVSDAVAPDRKIWPPRSLIVVLAAMAGFGLAVGGIVLRALLREYAPVPTAA